MAGSIDNSQLTRVRYRPIEAAIRWSGLVRHERRIIDALRGKAIPETTDFPQWPSLRLFTERIFDAIHNDELPHAINGVVVRGRVRASQSNLTVRHVDLKSWMCRYYPEDRPDFLFSQLEQQLLPPTITVDALHALLVDRESLKLRLAQRDRELEELRLERKKLLTSENSLTSSAMPDGLSVRAETTYQHIIGSMLELFLGKSPAGQPYSSFRTQEAVITAMVALHGTRLGISQRTLERKFATARRTLMDG